jgi:hypothetical protein
VVVTVSEIGRFRVAAVREVAEVVLSVARAAAAGERVLAARADRPVWEGRVAAVVDRAVVAAAGEGDERYQSCY